MPDDRDFPSDPRDARSENSPTSDKSARAELYTIAFERSQTPMMIADAGDRENNLVFANKAFLDLTGYSLPEIVGRDCRFLQGEGTSKETIAEIGEAIRAKVEVNVTILNYRKDGREFWNKLHISPVKDDRGEVIHYFASQTDVTEARQIAILEASEQRLLKEVDHRAKNLMAVVNSIVRLTASEDPARYAASVRERVQTLAEVHTLLAENAWQSIPLGSLFSLQFRSLEAPKVRLDGPPISIDATDAQPVALIIHELAVNAKSFGALSSVGGSLDVTWRPLGIGGYEIVWRERGGNAPLQQRKPGFGTVMVDALIERQLRGSIHRDWLEGGLELVIQLPGPTAAQALA